MRKFFTGPLCLIILLFACRDKYNSPVRAPATGYLVIEGFINNDTGVTQIKISRTVSLDTAMYKAEDQAIVEVQSKLLRSGLVLFNLGNGDYSGVAGATDPGDQYRLHVTTPDGKEYFSDYSQPKQTPPIDSVSWKPTLGGVTIYVSTHDPSSQITNYRWDYDETWRYEAKYSSSVIYDPTASYYLRNRQDSEQLRTCYLSASSASILVASTVKFSEDRIFEYPVAVVSTSTSNRLMDLYSINVKQYGISTDALNYFQKLQKNTEQIGSIFDAQPSEISGNIHASTSEPVIGFVECSRRTEKRIFIQRAEIPPSQVYTGDDECGENQLGYDSVAIQGYLSGYVFIPTSLIYGNFGPIGVNYSSIECVDCRQKGGVLAKPPFWP